MMKQTENKKTPACARARPASQRPVCICLLIIYLLLICYVSFIVLHAFYLYRKSWKLKLTKKVCFLVKNGV